MKTVKSSATSLCAWGQMMEMIKKGVDANEAVAKCTGNYGRFDEAAKYIDPRHE